MENPARNGNVATSRSPPGSGTDPAALLLSQNASHAGFAATREEKPRRRSALRESYKKEDTMRNICRLMGAAVIFLAGAAIIHAQGPNPTPDASSAPPAAVTPVPVLPTVAPSSDTTSQPPSPAPPSESGQATPLQTTPNLLTPIATPSSG